MRYIVMAVFSLFLAGCVSNRQGIQPHIEPGHKKCIGAAPQMALAESKASSLKYRNAINDYIAIFKKKTGTECRKKAALKVVYLSCHPDNPEKDYNLAQEWMQIYSGLALSPEENENLLMLSVLIRQINQLKSEKETLVSLRAKQKKQETHLKKAVLACEAKQASLETKLDTLEKKFQKIKDIDVQMYKNRKGKTAP